MCQSLPGVLIPQGPPVAGSQGAQVLLLSPQIRAQNEGGVAWALWGFTKQTGELYLPLPAPGCAAVQEWGPSLGEPEGRTVGAFD